MRTVLISKRNFIIAVALIALATVAGIAILWPSGESPSLRLTEGLAAGDTELAEVSSIIAYSCSGFGTDTCRRVVLELKSGPDEGTATRIDLGTGGIDPDLSVGDEMRVMKTQLPPGVSPGTVPAYSLLDFERKAPMLWLAVLFAALVILFGRWRGALSLVGLAISLVIVLVFVVPAILRESSPLAVALVGSMAIMLTTIPLAHGVGPKSLAAIVGTATSLLLVIGLAVVATDLTHLTGLSSEDAAVLAANNSGLSLQGLLVAGMVIGSLGVLDDVTVSQASTVMALRAANPYQRFGELYRRAIEVGRDHVTATVNTLVLAYVGSSLTTLLIFGSGEIGVLDAVNLEIVAGVIVGTLVGSIGLILAVPITTALAALLAEDVSPQELVADPQAGHTH